MTRFSTNALTARYCAQKGWPCQTVQAFYGGRRHDLFGIADSIVLPTRARILFVQNCSYGSREEHARSIDANDLTQKVIEAGAWIELWEWKRKKVGRKKLWFLRVQVRGPKRWSEPLDWSGPFDLYPARNGTEGTGGEGGDGVPHRGGLGKVRAGVEAPGTPLAVAPAPGGALPTRERPSREEEARLKGVHPFFIPWRP